MSLEAKWVGAEGAAFQRVSAAFQSIGLNAPKTDVENGDGAYGMNIINQYRADLSKDEALAVVRFGMASSLAYIQACTPQDLEDITRNYSEDE